jgi:CelD/BcsL family acetyltransferase involved in cellulose biosynthesis
MILLLHLAEQAAVDGIRRIDFGTGDERYKQQFKSGDIPLLVGGVDFRVACASIRRGWHSVNQWVRRSPYREYLEIPINATRKYRQRLAFRYVRSDSQNRSQASLKARLYMRCPR